MTTAASCAGATATSATAPRPALLGFFLYMVAFMDTTATIPTGSMAERWKWKSFAQWGLFCGAIYYPLFAAWTWGGGWLAKTLEQHAPRCRLRRLRRFRRRARRRWRRCPAGVDRARPTPRQVRRRRQAEDDSRATTSRWPSSAASSCCSAGSGSTPRRRSPPRTCSSPRWRPTRRSPRAVGATVAMYCMICQDRQAGSGDDGQRHARRPGGDHGPVRLRRPVGGSAHRRARGGHRDRSRMFIEKRGIDDPVGAIAVHGIGGTFGVLCVGIFANGKYGAGWNGSNSTRRRGPDRGRRRPVLRPVARCRRSSGR